MSKKLRFATGVAEDSCCLLFAQSVFYTFWSGYVISLIAMLADFYDFS